MRGWLQDGDSEPLWVRTSGTTGEPKDVALSASALTASARATLDYLGGPGHWVLALPAHYVAGLQVIVRSILGEASPVVLADQPSVARAFEALDGPHRYLAVVPTQLHRWLGVDSERAALAGFDAVLVGGGAADADLLAAARGAGIRAITTYGMSETCGGCVYDGVPLDGVGIALDRSGRIRVAGPVLFDGYVGRPDLTADVLRDGWLVTPDLGHLDADGRLVVTGRVDDVVVTGGVNVAVDAVERTVAALAVVEHACVVGVPHPEWGSEVVAVVVASEGADTDRLLTDVRTAVVERHDRAWAPRRVVVVDALPMLESGKVDRQAVLRFLGGAA